MTSRLLPNLVRFLLVTAAIALVVTAIKARADAAVAPPCPGPASPPNASSPSYCPVISADPSRLATRPGEVPLSVVGERFSEGPVVEIYLQLPGGPSLLGRTYATTASGHVSWSDAIELPPCGSYDLTAEQHDSDVLVRWARTAVTVTCPELTLTPNGLPRATLPAAVAVRGTGYDPETTVVLSVAENVLAEVPTDQEGAFEATVEMPLLDCGVAEVIGVEKTYGHTFTLDTYSPAPAVAEPLAGAPFTVTCAALTVRPGVAATGTTVTVEGSGFPPGAPVGLRWRLPYGGSLPCTGAADELAATRHGTFAVSCLMLPHDRLGPRTITARGVVADAPLLVVAGPVEPTRRAFSNGRRLLNRR